LKINQRITKRPLHYAVKRPFVLIHILLAATDRCVVETDVATASVLETASDCVATSLKHLAASGITTTAFDAAAIFGEFAFAQAASQLAIEQSHAIELTAD